MTKRDMTKRVAARRVVARCVMTRHDDVMTRQTTSKAFLSPVCSSCGRS